MTHYTIRNNVVSGDYLYAPAWNNLNESDYSLSATIAWTLGNRSGSFSSGSSTKRYYQSDAIDFNFISYRDLTYNQVDYRFVGVCAAVIQNGSPSIQKVIAAEHDYGSIIAQNSPVGNDPNVTYTDVSTPITYRKATIQLWPIVGAADYVYSFAVYEKKVSVTATFNANGGTAGEATRGFYKNDTLGTLPTATFSGFTFLGWFTAATGGTQVASDTRITADTTYYAHWQGTLNYDAGGGTGTMSPTTFERGVAFSLSSPEGYISRTNYTFLGWAINDPAATPQTGSVTLNGSPNTAYAKWALASTSFSVRVTKTHPVGALKLKNASNVEVATEDNSGVLYYEGAIGDGPYKIWCTGSDSDHALYDYVGIDSHSEYTFSPTGGHAYNFTYEFKANELRSVTINSTGHGSAAITSPSVPDSAGKYGNGRLITLTATPDTGYALWAVYVLNKYGNAIATYTFSGGTIADDNTINIDVLDDLVIDVEFKATSEIEAEYAHVSVGYNGDSNFRMGSVAITGKSDASPISTLETDGSAAYVAIGTNVVVKAIAAIGYRFAGWYNGTGESAERLSVNSVASIAVTADGMTICARFVTSTAGIYKWEGGTTNKTMTWRSKTYAATKPFSPAACRVDALGYNGDEGGSSLTLSVESFSSPNAAPTAIAKIDNISNQNARRLPSVRAERYHQVEVVANVEVDAVLFGTSMGGLAT